MPFVVIGGHAMSAHGVSRQTGDIDLLVPRKDREKWIELLSQLRYKTFQDDSRFARFKPSTIAEWPIDLMFVDDTTFDKIYHESFLSEFGYSSAHVASALHMVTLKTHALKYTQEHRSFKDYNDLINLLRKYNKLVSFSQLREICLKYGSEELFDRLKKDLGDEYDR